VATKYAKKIRQKVQQSYTKEEASPEAGHFEISLGDDDDETLTSPQSVDNTSMNDNNG